MVLLVLGGQTWILKIVLSCLPFSFNQNLNIFKIVGKKRWDLYIRDPLFKKLTNFIQNIDAILRPKPIFQILKNSLNHLRSFLMHLQMLIANSLVDKYNNLLLIFNFNTLSTSTGYHLVALLKYLQPLFVVLLPNTNYPLLVQLPYSLLYALWIVYNILFGSAWISCEF